MDFKLSEEQTEYRELAKEFAAREMQPQAEKAEKGEVDVRLIHQKIFESGLMNVQVPESMGGLGLSLWNACLIAEGLGYGCSGMAAAPEFNSLAQLPILYAATESQKEALLPPLNEKLTYVGVSLSGFFEADGRFQARKQGEQWLLKGTGLILNGQEAEWSVLPVRDGSQTLFAVVKKGSAGFKVKERPNTVGRKVAAMEVAELHDVSVPDNHMIVADARQLEAIRSAARVILASGMIGIAQAAFEFSKKYANERQTFGKPISQHQAVAFMMADMVKDIESARLLSFKGAVLVDAAQSAEQSSIIALAFASEMATRVAIDAVQVFGGYGYSREYPVEKLMRDAKSYQCIIPRGYMEYNHLGKTLVGTSS